MKIAGITWWRGNYGSVLQAYALARTLNSFDGIDYEVLDQFGSIQSLKGILERARDKRPSQIAKKLRWNYLMPELKQRRAALDDFVEQHVPVSTRAYGASELADANDVYDGFVCGSDQIWNPNLGPMSDLYWLSFAHDEKKKVAYAPSIGVESLTDEQVELIGERARRFDALSCREGVGAQLIHAASDRNCTHVSDPTLLLTAHEWRALANQREASWTEGGPYALAYLLRGTADDRRAIESHCAAKGLRTVSFPYLDPEHPVRYDRKFGDERIFDAGPADLISLIAGAQCVFCDSYHASIFSTLMHRNFYLFPKLGEVRSNRLDDLLDTLGIGDRNVDARDLAGGIERVGAIDWPAVDKHVREFRAASMAYLRGAFETRTEAL